MEKKDNRKTNKKGNQDTKEFEQKQNYEEKWKLLQYKIINIKLLFCVKSQTL